MSMPIRRTRSSVATPQHSAIVEWPRARAPPRFDPPQLRPIQALNTFTIFSNLPPELRLKIWRLLFPGSRNVRIDLGTAGTPRAELPKTLFINHESRTETLKKYCIIFPKDIFDYSTQSVTPPFCLNPSIDSVYFLTAYLHRVTMFPMFKIWLDHLDLHIPGGLRSILHLNINGFPITSMPTAPFDRDVGGIPLCWTVLRFGGLKRLSIDDSYGEGRDRFKWNVQQFLEFHKDRFVSGVPPEVTVSY